VSEQCNLFHCDSERAGTKNRNNFSRNFIKQPTKYNLKRFYVTRNVNVIVLYVLQ